MYQTQQTKMRLLETPNSKLGVIFFVGTAILLVSTLTDFRIFEALQSSGGIDGGVGKVVVDDRNSNISVGKIVDDRNFNTYDTKKDERKYKERKKDIKVVALIGERNSGTNWMSGELNGCFGKELKIHRTLTRFKHWFQYDDGKDHPETLVIALFRDPYHWVLGMKDKPHHAPLHASLEWKEFVTKTWTMPREGFDLMVTDEKNRICSEHFRYHELRSCIHHTMPLKYFPDRKFSEQYPMYEMRNDGSGVPFSNILEMRAAKIRDFLSYDSYSYVRKVIPVRYEEIVSGGTAPLITEIENLTGVKAQCTPAPPQHRETRPIDKDYLQHMNANVDWDAEALIGYEMQTETTG